MRLLQALIVCLLLAIGLLGQDTTANPPAGSATGAAPGAAQSPVDSSGTASLTSAMTVEQRADLFIARRDYASAVELLMQAVKEHKGNGDIYNRLGIANQQMERFGAATRYYKLAIKASSKQGVFYNNLGTVYYEQGKYKQAVREYQQAIVCDSTQATFFVNLGSAEFARKNYPPAMDAYRQALALNPNALFPQDSGGTMLQDPTRKDEPRYHYELAKLFCSLGQMDDAMHQFRQALELHYSGIRDSLTDPGFAPLRARADFQALMNIPPPKGTGAVKGLDRSPARVY